MSHPEQMAFLRAVANANTELVSGGRVLEIGSYDVNGSVRGLFEASGSYLGVDLFGGPGVDWVGFGHDLSLPDDSFDLALSAECFEHDPHWANTFENMARLTRPGGVVAFTCATRGRPEHGTRRTRLDESPGTQAVGIDYYRNLTEADFCNALSLASLFDEWHFWTSRYSFDLYFVGIVRTVTAVDVLGQFPDDSAIADINRMMSRTDRAIRLPLRAARLLVRQEVNYQNLILAYWAAIHRLRVSGYVSRWKCRVRRLLRLNVDACASQSKNADN